MMGIADFPIEVLHLLKIKPAEPSTSGEPTSSSPESSTPHQEADPSHSKSDAPSFHEGKVRSPSASTVSLATQDSQATEADVTSEPRSTSQEQSSQGSALSPTSTSNHRSFLGKSLGGSSSRSNSPKRRSSANNPSHHPDRSNSGSQAAHMSLDAAVGAGKGVGRMVGAGLKSPMDFTLGLARGFHNAPKLYGDESVRQADKVTDFQSGLKAAGKVSSYETTDNFRDTDWLHLGFWLWAV